MTHQPGDGGLRASSVQVNDADVGVKRVLRKSTLFRQVPEDAPITTHIQVVPQNPKAHRDGAMMPRAGSGVDANLPPAHCPVTPATEQVLLIWGQKQAPNVASVSRIRVPQSPIVHVVLLNVPTPSGHDERVSGYQRTHPRTRDHRNHHRPIVHIPTAVARIVRGRVQPDPTHRHEADLVGVP